MYVQYYVLPFPPKGMVYPSGPLLPTFILILLHSIERVGGSLNRALFWNMCSVLRVRSAVLQYCTVAPVVPWSSVFCTQCLPLSGTASACGEGCLRLYQPRTIILAGTVESLVVLAALLYSVQPRT